MLRLFQLSVLRNHRLPGKGSGLCATELLFCIDQLTTRTIGLLLHGSEDISLLFTQKGTRDHPGGAQRHAEAKSFSCRPCSLADVCRLCSLLFNCYCCWSHWLFMHKMEGELGFL